MKRLKALFETENPPDLGGQYAPEYPALELIHLFLIGEAKNLLTAGEMNITEISYSLGFDNVTYFSRLFKKEVGVAPNKFKELFLN